MNTIETLELFGKRMNATRLRLQLSLTLEWRACHPTLTLITSL